MAKQNELDKLAATINKSFGDGAAKKASVHYNLNVIPTGSLALDYTLGTGGWPRGHMVGVFGPRDIGKSSIIGFNAIRNAHEAGLNVVIIAVESNAYDKPDWMEKNGVNPDKVYIFRPDNGEDAFRMMHKAAHSGVVDLIIFDSIGGLLAPSEVDDKGNMKAGGQAGLITWGIKRCIKPIWDNNVCCLMLNQIRDNMRAQMPGAVQQPGGHALEHCEAIICQLKRTSNRFMTKVDGEDIEYGNEIAVVIKRNKLSEGSGQKALFNFYNMALPGIEIGIDRIADALNTGKRLGIIRTRGAWIDLPDSTSHNGAKAAGDYLNVHPEVYKQIREGVVNAMLTMGHSFELTEVDDEQSH